MKKTNNSFLRTKLFFFLGSAVVLVLVVVFILSYNDRLFPRVTETPIPPFQSKQPQTFSGSPISEPQTDLSVEWQELKSHKLGLEIKFPPEWQSIDTGGRVIIFSSPDFQYDGDTLIQGAEIWINQLNNPSGLSLETIVEQEKSQLGSSFVSQEITLASDLQAITLLQGDTLVAVFVWQAGNKYLRIGLNYGEIKRKQEFERTLNIMLNSLQLQLN